MLHLALLRKELNFTKECKMSTKNTLLSLKNRLRAVLKASDFGAVKGARIRLEETEDGYIRGLIYSPMFTGVDV